MNKGEKKTNKDYRCTNYYKTKFCVMHNSVYWGPLILRIN